MSKKQRDVKKMIEKRRYELDYLGAIAGEEQMKTKEFIKKLEELGYEVSTYDDFIEVFYEEVRRY